MSRLQLAQLFAEASPVSPSAIEGYLYRGVSLGLPAWVEALSWKKFAKAFVRDDAGGVHGWNVRIEQDALTLPWRAKQRRGKEWRFGPFGLNSSSPSGDVELDYSLGTRGLSPLRRLRDPLRRLDAESDLLLGRSLVDVGLGRRLATPSWFVLERDQLL